MNEATLSRWFAKEQWRVGDSALLLYGFDPEQWSHAIPKLEHADDVYRQFALWDLSLEGMQSLLHDLRCDLVYEVSERRDGEGDLLIPRRVAQWAWDVRQRFWFSDTFIRFIKNPVNGIHYADNTWIDRGYSQWAKLDAWKLNEAADLLSGCQPHRDYELKSWHKNALGDDITLSLERLALTKRLDVVSSDGHLYFPARDIVKWAVDKGFLVPPKLLSFMGFKTVASNNPAQLPRQKCEHWLKDIVSTGGKSMSKERYRAEALSKFPGLSNRGFNTVWEKVTQGTPWQNPGRIKQDAKS